MQDHGGGLIGDLLCALREHLEMDVAFVGEFTDGRRVFRYVEGELAEGTIAPGEGDPLESTYCQRIVSGALPSIVSDVTVEPAIADLVESYPVASHLGVPITFPDGRIYGTLCCASTAPRDLGRGDLAALSIVADVVTAQLVRIEEHLEDGLRAHRQVQQVLDDVAFHPVFQPIVDLQSGRVLGAEALTRFSAEPAMPPDKWFALAAEAGLAEELEVATLRAALAHLPDLPADAYLSVNVSPAVLDAALPVLRETDGARVVVELTEHAEIADYDSLVATAAELRSRGFRVAIDDTGSGYASLSHVLRLQPDIVKIDLALVRGVDIDLARQSLARGVVDFSANLGATVVAEGIETAGELLMLASLGVNAGQGYYLGRPAPLPLAEPPALDPPAALTPPVAAVDAVHHVFRSNPMALTVTTLAGRFVAVSDKAAELFGLPAEEFAGRSWQELAPADDPEVIYDAFRRVIAGEEEVTTVPVKIAHVDGSTRALDLHGRAIRDAQGRPLWLFNVLEPR